MTSNRLALFLIWLMVLVAYVDRVNIAIAGPTIVKSLHMHPAAFGMVLSAFTLGYALMQVPGGWLADRIGARPILVAALLIWSAFTAMTGRVTSLLQLLTVRVLFGFGEGIENGAQFKLIADRFNVRQRSQANSLFLSALALGPAIAAPVTSWLIVHVGWRATFGWFAVVGVLVAAILAAFLPPPPTATSAPTGPEIAASDTYDDVVPVAVPRSWMTFAAYLFFNIAFWGFIGWMPTYLSSARHIALAKLGPIASIPYLFGFVGMLVMGWLGSGVLFRYRAAAIGAGYLVAGVFLAAAFRANHVAACIGFLSAAAFFFYGGFGPFWAVALDSVPDEIRGVFSAFVNLGGQIGGFTAPTVVGLIFERTHSFTGGFLFMIGALVVSAACLAGLQGLPWESHRSRCGDAVGNKVGHGGGWYNSSNDLVFRDQWNAAMGKTNMTFEMPAAIEPEVIRYAESEHITEAEAIVRLIQAGLAADRREGPKVLNPAQEMIGALSDPESVALLDEVVVEAYRQRTLGHPRDFGL